MSIRQKTLQALATAGVVALALFLAGCGGGGGGSPAAAGPTEEEQLMTARAAANTASQTAMTAAADAQTAADMIADAAGAGSASAMMAQEAAGAAQTAADMAGAAATMAAGATTSADARTHQMSAEGHKMTAEEQLAAVMAIEGSAQFVADVGAKAAEDALRRQAVAAVKDQVEAAVTAAMEARDAANSAAMAAEEARDNAQSTEEKARMARTDDAAAKTQYEAAVKAANMARMAADEAEASYQQAKMALVGFDDDGTEAGAETVLMNAMASQMEAETAKMTAKTQQELAETASRMAMDAVNMHVLRVFISANGQDINQPIADDPDTTDVDETMTVDQLRAAEVERFATALTSAATDGFGTIPGFDGSSTPDRTMPEIEVEWAAEDDPDTGTLDESELRITINPDTQDNFVASNLGTNQIQSNYRTIDGVGDFTHGFEIWRGGDTPEDKTRVIVFTDKQQGTAAVTAVNGSPPLSAKSLSNADTTSGAAFFEESDVSPDRNTITGVTYYEDATDRVDREAFTDGTLTCPSGTECSYVINENLNPDGTIDITIELEGYVFTGYRPRKDAIDAVQGMPEAENNDYLAFGLWLYEDDVDGMEAFGAISGGGRLYPTGLTLIQLQGQAIYNGKAVGAHHMDGTISWFDADASLTMDWDVSIPGAWGRATGEISNIRVGGGDPMAESIHLNADANGNIFEGEAVMGAETAPGLGDYEFTGGWTAALYGVEGADSYPDAISGTFGVTNADETETYVGAYGVRGGPVEE